MTTTTRRIPCVTLLDGGTGEELFARGLPDDRFIWSATALVHEQHHKLLREVHTSFLDANADYITCNNYGVTPGVGFRDEEIVRYTAVAGRVARDACDRWTKTYPTSPKPKICGSLPPLLESYRADKVPEHEEGVRLYAMIARTLKPFVDCYLAETLSSTQEAKMALLGVQQAKGEKDRAVGVMVSFTLDSQGRLRSGENVCKVVENVLSFTAGTSRTELQAILFNCSQPEDICKALKELHDDDNTQASLRSRGVRLGAYANRLTVIPDDWALAESSEPQAMRKDLAVERYRDFVSQWVELGADVVGGCCGIGPEYIASIHDMLQQQGRR
ncbi:Homocysteine S-methyltransferase [Phytophthora infestans]|nr:Homocysteine S-methyltransferase [Phytophthora infestans]